MVDFSNVAMGKLQPDPDTPKLAIGPFLRAVAVPAPPPRADWMSEINVWPLHLNDRVGDCTIVGQSHALLALSHYGSEKNIQVTDDEVLDAYSDVSGYDRNTGKNDNGALVQKALDHWRKVGLGGHKITAFAHVNVKDRTEVETAVNLFGTLLLGIALPISAQKQIAAGEPWDVTAPDRDATPYSWGGHCTATGYYDRDSNRIRVSTWGQTQDMTEAFWYRYVDEAWIVITPEWLKANGTTPGGVDLTGLGEAFTALTGESNPFPAPDPNPDTPPVVDPPAPVDPADLQLATAARTWMQRQRRGDSRLFLHQLREWLNARNL